MKAQYDQQKAPIDAVVAQLAVQDTDLAAKGRTIEARLSRAAGPADQGVRHERWHRLVPPVALPVGVPADRRLQGRGVRLLAGGQAYVWAADGPSSYDCSGLTLASWKQVGVYLPHNAAAQRRSMPYVSRANLQHRRPRLLLQRSAPRRRSTSATARS